MKRLNKTIVMFLSVVMLCSVFVPDLTVRAEESVGTSASGERLDDTDETQVDNVQQDESDEAQQEETEVEQSETDVPTTTAGLLNYIGVDQPYLTTPSTQKIVVSYGDGTESVSEAKIVYQKADGTMMEDSMSSRQEELFLFEHSFTSDNKGVYTLLQFVYVENGEEHLINLADIGIEAKFGVNEQYPGYGSDAQGTEEFSQEDVDVSVVSLEADEVESADTDIEEAIDNTEEVVEGAVPQVASLARSVDDSRATKDNVVVVLDPGHGGSDSGAVGFGLQEKDLTLKIATYCKEALGEYSGVIVYMTREDDRYLGNKPGDAASDISNRVNKAKDWGADLLVSIHVNSGGGKGVEVWYPNNNYKPTVGQEGKDAAQQILDELIKLGLNNRGIKIKNTVHDKYDDGSLQDYYGIIRRSKLAGFPGIIVEHAFIDNASDAELLKDESFLKSCGVADATGIANHFGLSKGGWEKVGEDWKYSNGDGTYKTSQWISSDGHWYYVDDKGVRQTGWIVVGNYSYYMNSDGVMKTGWLKLDNTWYYLNANGSRVVDGWRWINGYCYYFYSDGRMAADTWIGNDYVNANGAWVKGKQKPTAGWKAISGRWKYMGTDGKYVTSSWLKLGSTWYYLDANGWMKTGWLKLGNTWYYLESNGAMVANRWRWINNKCYYFAGNGSMAADTWIGNSYVNANGAWVKGKQKPTAGWKAISGRWKYMGTDGKYVTSRWLKLGSTWYYLDENGWMRTGWLKLGNAWYYLESNGAMVANRWRWINNKCYYFYSNGSMAADTWIGNDYVNANGAWVPGQQKITPGWKSISGRWKYMNADGSYVTSRWLQLGTAWYHFDGEGWMQIGWLTLNSKKYYLAANGMMVAGRWCWIEDKCYYFNANGSMATDTWIDNSYVDVNGVWVPDKKQYTEIMGQSSVTAEQLANYYKKVNPNYPSYYTNNDKEAKTIEDFCRIYVEECITEGVKPEVAFAQAMLETGFLRFGGDVSISQYNFAGMGATGNGVKGNSFSSVRIGIRAQVQHLKCYASTDKLNGGCVDPRWGDWLRGKAPYVEWLSIPNNPYGTGWASSATYAESIKSIIANIQ